MSENPFVERVFIVITSKNTACFWKRTETTGYITAAEEPIAFPSFICYTLPWICLLVFESQESEAQSSQSETLDDAIYIGEYLDLDNDEPGLEIAKVNDEEYIVQIGIYRLTALSDGIGVLTPEGMLFTATDASGNPISGIITVEDQIATVMFTDSTWDLLENGSVFLYIKDSDTPNLWSE